MRIGVGIATAGRPDLLEQTVIELRRQTRPADRVIICPASPKDCYRTESDGELEIIYCARGPSLTAQRNEILTAAGDLDVIAFFDDDFFPEPGFLFELQSIMEKYPDVVVATGAVLADGILGPGLMPEEARKIIENAPPLVTSDEASLQDVYNGYGCNMALRLAPLQRNDLRFDEELPFYAWLEDVDFSRRLAQYGRIVKCMRLRGVHLGSKSGRSPGKRLGYSQVANPWYLARKGTLHTRRAASQVMRNILANLFKTVRPEPWVDRRGRLRGNILAIRDLLSGKLHPGNVKTLK